jgi:membrane peptidoglycan carboxypeptidase
MLVALVLGEENVRRTWIDLDRVPVPVQEAIVSSEDRRFRQHPGFDVRGTVRALFTNVKAGGVREGGSTITQQLARGLFLGRERTVVRKVREAALAAGLEILLSKNEILEMYLNSVYWGQAGTTGIGGIAEATRWYFGVPVESLTVAQGALLAALIPAPNAADPFEHPDVALERRALVLDALVREGRLDAAGAQRLARSPLGVRRGALAPERFPSYVGWTRDEVSRRLPRHALTSWGLAIFTHLDLAWQAQAEAGLASGLARIEVGLQRRGLQGAFVALDAGTGAVRAMVGGRAPRPGDFNRAVQAKRQTGSAIKPIVYAAALSGERGTTFTPATTVPDTQRVFGRGRWAWKPKNSAGSYHESVTLAEALALSLNVATANLVERIGPATVAEMAERFGLGRMKAVPSIGLGTNEVTPLALTSAFAVFAGEGMRRDPHPIRTIIDARGRAIGTNDAQGEQVIGPGLAALMTGLLEDVVNFGVAYPLRGWYGFDRPVGGKTGTTDDFLDAWFVGFTPDVVAGLWVGYDRPASLGRPAAAAAIPVWAGIVGRMLEGFPPRGFASDATLEWTDVNPWSGLLADSTCSGMRMPFLPGTMPSAWCSPGWGSYGELDTLFAGDSAAFAAPDTERFEEQPPAPDEAEFDTTWVDTIPPPH